MKLVKISGENFVRFNEVKKLDEQLNKINSDIEYLKKRFKVRIININQELDDYQNIKVVAYIETYPLDI